MTIFGLTITYDFSEGFRYGTLYGLFLATCFAAISFLFLKLKYKWQTRGKQFKVKFKDPTDNASVEMSSAFESIRLQSQMHDKVTVVYMSQEDTIEMLRVVGRYLDELPDYLRFTPELREAKRFR